MQIKGLEISKFCKGIGDERGKFHVEVVEGTNEVGR